LGLFWDYFGIILGIKHSLKVYIRVCLILTNLIMIFLLIIYAGFRWIYTPWDHKVKNEYTGSEVKNEYTSCIAILLLTEFC